jgi:pimeloyl-ACP methyl ester carboxylesterase
LGGMIAMRFALKYPRSTRALLLFDTSPGMGTQGLWSANRAAMEALVRGQGVATMMRGLYAQGANAAGVKSRSDVPSSIIAFLQRQQQLTPDGFLGITRAAGDAASVLEQLPDINVPTLIVTGDSDFFRDASIEMKRRLPGARFVQINGSWHGTNMWQPEKFTSTVLDFLADVDSAKPVAGSEEL